MILGAAAAARPARDPSERWLTATGLGVAALVVLPVVAIVAIAAFPDDNIWPHLAATVLPGYVQTTLALMLGVGLSTFATGTLAAWLVTVYDFPCRRLIEWLLVLPLAMPTYIIAYAYVELLDASGWIQSGLRALFGWRSTQDYWFPEIRSLEGAVFIMGLVLYPYVYLTARAAFLQQARSLIDASRSLGHPIWSTFHRVALPLARPAIVAGLALALMECLNDIGAVRFLGVHTLTEGVYTTWLQKNNLGGAAQIAVVMIVVVFALLGAERLARRGRGFHAPVTAPVAAARIPVAGARGLLLAAALVVPVMAGFALPASVLVGFAVRRFAEQDLAEFLANAGNSLTLSALAALCAVAIGLFLAHAARATRAAPVRIAAIAASVGYAIPGAVLAIGILVPLARFDNALDAFARATFGVATGLVLSGTMFAIVFAYVVRFMAVSYGAVDAGLARLSPNLPLAARSLGRTPLRALVEVQVPLMKPAILSAALLVFVDSMKELPATLLLRPFGFDTLATQVYTYASLHIIEEAAFSALAIVAVGVLPVVALTRTMTRGAPGAEQASAMSGAPIDAAGPASRREAGEPVI